MTAAASAGFMYAPEIERMNRADLGRLQLERLKRTLAHAYANVPHTRAAFAAHGVTPDDLRSLDDLRRFPFTLKTDLRDNYPFGLFAVRASGWCACTPVRAPPASPRWWAIPPRTSTPGPN